MISGSTHIRLERVTAGNVLAVCDERTKPMDWDLSKVQERFAFLFNRPIAPPSDLQLDQQVVYDWVRQEAHRIYEQKMQDLERKLEALRAVYVENQPNGAGHNPFDFSTAEVEQETMLRSLDHLWLIHLQQMDYLREGVGLRGYGQKNPLHEYQREGFLLFQEMIVNLKETVVRQLFYYELPDAEEYLAHLRAERARREAVERQMQMVHEGDASGGETGLSPVDSESGEKTQVTPDEARARLEAQRKARRKARRG